MVLRDVQYCTSIWCYAMCGTDVAYGRSPLSADHERLSPIPGNSCFVLCVFGPACSLPFCTRDLVLWFPSMCFVCVFLLACSSVAGPLVSRLTLWVLDPQGRPSDRPEQAVPIPAQSFLWGKTLDPKSWTLDPRP
eukprot:104422-Rhodomonas_salina.1